ncbi:MAG: hypothetical protein KAT46_02310, partial [Deltaproteobacteria bacterium]|nr:hypothetical protein [Deltaproteobacteria bacterium]
MILKRKNIDKLINGVRKNNGVFIAPAMNARQVVYRPVENLADMEFDYIIPRNSFKEVVFPQTEKVATFTLGRGGADMQDIVIDPSEVVVFGARPCDALSVGALRSVFT